MTKWGAGARLLFDLHTRLYRLSGGRLGGRFNGPILLLTTTGRKSGRQITRPLTYYPDGERYVVVGSNGGKPSDPAWVLNLRANPAATVQVGGRRLPVRARFATREEQYALWPRLLAQTPAWGRYRAKAARDLPMVILEPRTI